MSLKGAGEPSKKMSGLKRGLALFAIGTLITVPLLAQVAGPDYGEFGIFGMDRRDAV